MILLVAAACTGDSADGQATTETGDTTPATDTGPPAARFDVALTDIPGGTLLAAWSAGDEVWFAGGDLSNLVGNTGSIARLDPAAGTVCVEAGVADRTLWWLHGTSPADWYAVGAEGRVVHEVDGVRTREDLPTGATLFGVWATDTEAWAVGANITTDQSGEVWLRRDGAWSLVATTPAPLFKVWDRLIVGDGSAFRIEKDDTLTDITAPDRPRLVTIRGTGPDDAWAVGGLSSPILRHWDGSTWTERSVDLFCGSGGLNGVFTAADDDLWVAGGFGEMAVLADDAWDCPVPPLTLEHFHAVWRHEDTMYWAGGNLFSPGNNYGTIGRYGAPAEPLTLSCP